MRRRRPGFRARSIFAVPMVLVRCARIWVHCLGHGLRIMHDRRAVSATAALAPLGWMAATSFATECEARGNPRLSGDPRNRPLQFSREIGSHSPAASFPESQASVYGPAGNAAAVLVGSRAGRFRAGRVAGTGDFSVVAPLLRAGHCAGHQGLWPLREFASAIRGEADCAQRPTDWTKRVGYPLIPVITMP